MTKKRIEILHRLMHVYHVYRNTLTPEAEDILKEAAMELVGDGEIHKLVNAGLTKIVLTKNGIKYETIPR